MAHNPTRQPVAEAVPSRPAPRPRPPAVPPGTDPRTYRLAEVNRLMQSAYFSLFSVPNPQEPDVPIEAELSFPWSLLQRLPFLSGQLLAGVQVNEKPLRFQTAADVLACQLLSSNTVGQPIASVHILWKTIPWDYPASPYTNAPQTIINPFVSQRFEMLNGEFRFDDPQQSGVHGFGSGRTFPNFPNGLSLKIGAVIDILEGFGQLAGRTGLMVVNGEITPPNELALNIMQRILDPRGTLLTQRPLPPLREQPFPDPDATFMMLLGEPDPAHGSPLILGEGGAIEGVELYERLRLIDLDFAVLPKEGLKSQVRVGRVIGRARSKLHLPVNSTVPIPAQTTGSEFEFFDGRLPFGKIAADLVEGRGFPTPLAGAPSPLYRIGGFGPIEGGTGEFDKAQGIVSMNSVLSLFPRTFSNLYIFRFADSDGRFRPVAGSVTPGGVPK